jgi:hypothetical protein
METTQMAELITLKDAAASQTINIANRGTKQGEGVNIQYTTFTNNRPQTYANQIFVWESDSPDIPWNRDPIAKTPIAQDQYTYTQFVEFNYQVGVGYVLGYAVSDDPKSICTSLFYPKNEPPGQSDHLTIAMGDYGPGFLEISYKALANYNPTENPNYVAVWQAPQASYDGGPLGQADVQYKNVQGQATIMNLNLQINSTYSVGYFMTQKVGANTITSSLASQLTFRT